MLSRQKSFSENPKQLIELGHWSHVRWSNIFIAVALDSSFTFSPRVSPRHL